METEQVQTLLRLKSSRIVPWRYGTPDRHGEREFGGLASTDGSVGEAVRVQADGYLVLEDGENFPISLHYTAPPGRAVIPPMGDHILVTIAWYNLPVDYRT